MPWGTDRVLEITLARARELGLRTEVVESSFDIDERADLDRLVDEIVAGTVRLAHTAATLRACGLLPCDRQ
jgi:glycosyltransferase A (GT-A) superfamily protein (DUF2064 family)